MGQIWIQTPKKRVRILDNGQFKSLAPALVSYSINQHQVLFWAKWHPVSWTHFLWIQGVKDPQPPWTHQRMLEGTAPHYYVTPITAAFWDYTPSKMEEYLWLNMIRSKAPRNSMCMKGVDGCIKGEGGLISNWILKPGYKNSFSIAQNSYKSTLCVPNSFANPDITF